MNFRRIYEIANPEAKNREDETMFVFRLKDGDPLFTHEDYGGDKNIIYTSDDPMNPVGIFKGGGNVGDENNPDPVKIVDVYKINPKNFKDINNEVWRTEEEDDVFENNPYKGLTHDERSIKAKKELGQEQGYEGHIKVDSLGGGEVDEYGIYDRNKKPIESFIIHRLEDFITSGYQKYLNEKQISWIKRWIKHRSKYNLTDNVIIDYRIDEINEQYEEKFGKSLPYYIRYILSNKIKYFDTLMWALLYEEVGEKGPTEEEIDKIYKDFKKAFEDSYPIIVDLKNKGIKFDDTNNITGKLDFEPVPHENKVIRSKYGNLCRVDNTEFNKRLARIRKYRNKYKNKDQLTLFEAKSLLEILLDQNPLLILR
jgi:hypothetical protein